MDIERTMQFILEQQARHEAAVMKHDEEMAALRAAAAKHDEQIARNAEQIAKNTDQIAQHAAQIATLTDLVGRMAQSGIHLAEQSQGHEARLASLETKAAQLFERMDRFIQGLEGNGHKLQ